MMKCDKHDCEMVRIGAVYVDKPPPAASHHNDILVCMECVKDAMFKH